MSSDRGGALSGRSGVAGEGLGRSATARYALATILEIYYSPFLVDRAHFVRLCRVSFLAMCPQSRLLLIPWLSLFIFVELLLV